MRSDAIGYISVRWEAFGAFWKISFFFDIFGRFCGFLVVFCPWGLTIIRLRMMMGLLLAGLTIGSRD